MPDSAFDPTPDEEWAALMRRLRAQPPARPRPFFYARLTARLTAPVPARPMPLPAWLRRPAYAVLLGAVVLTLSGDGRVLPPLVLPAALGGSSVPPR